jgi:hypothetical protein
VKQEITAVPEIAIGHVTRSGRGIGLFHERRHRAHRGAVELLARADVAVIRCRVVGLDAEGDDAALGGSDGCAPTGFAESVRLADHVVGRQHQHQGTAIAFGREHGGDRDRGTGIAAQRFEHDVRLDAALAQLLRHHEAEVGIGDDDRAREQGGIRNARKHLLERRPLSDQGDELLGHALARDRPQPGSCAAAHDDRNDSSRHERFRRRWLDCKPGDGTPRASTQSVPACAGQLRSESGYLLLTNRSPSSITLALDDPQASRRGLAAKVGRSNT